MKSKSIVILCAFLLPIAVSGQKNGLTPTEECRMVKTADLADSKAPTFANYSARTSQDGPRAKLDLASNPIAKTYRTVLRLAMAEGPNFAGRYKVGIWGCGTSCAMFAVINLDTGRVITTKEFASVLGTYLMTDDFMPGTKSDSWGFRFKRNSNLLVVIGDPDEDESRTGAYYFVLRDERLTLIHTTHVTKNCDSH